MRRIGIFFSGFLVLVMVQGCGTTNRNKVVIDRPGQTTVTPAKTAPTPIVSPYSSKGGTAAKPGTVSVDISRSSTAAPPEEPPVAKTEVEPVEPTPVDSESTPPIAKDETTPEPAKPAAPLKPAKKKQVKESAMAKPGSSLGAVRQVNSEYKFIVIEFDSEKPLPIGTQLQIWRGGKLVGKAQLEEPIEHWPLGTASLVEGTPEKDDTVTQ